MSEAEQPPPAAEEKKRPFQFGLSTLFVVMTLWAIVCSIATPFIHSAREGGRLVICANNLKQIGLALRNYHGAHGCFPPAYIADESGKPMHQLAGAASAVLGKK